MAQDHFTDLQQLTSEELNAKLLEFQKELIKLNAQIATGTTPKSPGHVKKIKKNIARVYTLMNKKEVEKKHE